MNSLIEKAREYAFKMHNEPSKSQRYGSAPYSKHLLDVELIATKYIEYLKPDEIEDVFSAIFLHDTVEDTEVTPNILKRMFNDRIASIVLAVSNERGWDKKEILFKTLPKIWKDRLYIFTKLCDRIANTTNSKNGIDNKSESLYLRYKTEYPIVRYALKNKGEFKKMWDELDELNEYIK